MIHISQSTTDGVTSYFDADSGEVLSLLSVNDIPIPFITGQRRFIKGNYIIETACSNKAFIVYVSKYKGHPFRGALRIEAYHSRLQDGSLLIRVEMNNDGHSNTYQTTCPQVTTGNESIL